MNFYFLSQFSQIWILPPGLNLLLAIIGFLFIKLHQQRIGRILILLSLVSLWILSTPILAQLLISHLQNQYQPIQVDQLHQQNNAAIVVLGGGDLPASEYKTNHVPVGATFARLHYAVYLHKKLKIPIIVSGGVGAPHTGADLMSEELKNYFHTTAKWKERNSINTKDEGLFMVSLLEKHHIKVIYLITNAWHIPRAMYTFNAAFKNTGIKIIAAPMGYMNLHNKHKFFDYLPTVEGLNVNIINIHEYVGMLAYRIMNINYQ